MSNKTDQEKLDYIRQCFKDGEKDYVNGDCVDGKAFVDSLDALIELEEDEDSKFIVEKSNSPVSMG
ncbi:MULTISPECIES: hypothetical protein [Vibrio]|uniref:hypothetical protein n=1 Tax=Vibrio TaxID=662 RepID=UPI000BA90DC3|nr:MULTISPECIES: hypothetical protein [Vibrio]MDE1240514.1 hypothetical protein [Vibrio aestuarianus]PAR26843.1 hypothetical protein CGU00_17035 [Vibrio metoecus]PAR62107.1 hypothetical protein CGT90_08555 [Vibrio metoecus]